jgi:RHS repeat-associated protein
MGHPHRGLFKGAPPANILAHADSVMGDWFFNYDDLNRLQGATDTDTVASSNVPWTYIGNFGCWAYDAYGNRRWETMSTTNCSSGPPKASWADYNAANNQLSSTSYGGIVYDAAGNLLSDSVNEYWYDAEGRICATQMLGGGQAYQYVYDAEGARIAIGTLATAPAAYTPSGNIGISPTCAAATASNFTLQNQYLVDQGGNQVTEFGFTNWLHSNVWIGGKVQATYDLFGPALHFNLEDPLGTKRVEANIIGQWDENCTGLPFGNDVNNPWTVNCLENTTGTLDTWSDATEHHFSNKERDALETGNDYFMARYYNSFLGRFITPDWSVKETPVPYAVFTDPQSLNLYAYVRNNPLIRIDPNGHDDLCDFQCRMKNTWNDLHQIKNDYANLNKSTQVTFEAGFGGKASAKIGPLEVHAGITLHDEKSYNAGDRKLTDGPPIKDKLEGDAGAKLGPLGIGGEISLEHTDGKGITLHNPPDAAVESPGGGTASSDGERLSFGGTLYYIVGGGLPSRLAKRNSSTS